MKRVLILILLIGLISGIFTGFAYSEPTKFSKVNVNVVNAETGKPFQNNDIHTYKVWVYLYKGDYVQGAHYDKVYEADMNGNVTFMKVPTQEMILMVNVVDNYITPEGYHLMTDLGIKYVSLNTIPGDMNITMRY